MTEDAFRRAIDDLRFDDAEPLVRDDEERRAALDAARAEAAIRAKELSSSIQRLARDHSFEALLTLAEDPTTAPLIKLLPKELARGAEVQLEGARKWRMQRISAAQRHLRRAAEAIDGYDTARARMELHKIEQRWLTEAELARRRELDDRLEAVAAERLEIEMRTNEVLSQHQTETALADRRRRRRTILLATLVAVAVAAALAYRALI